MNYLITILQALTITSYALLTILMVGLAVYYLARQRDLSKGLLWLWLATVEIAVGLLALN